MGVVPAPINAGQCAELVKLLENPPKGEEDFLLNLLTNRVPPGVDDAAYVKADFLTAIVKGLSPLWLLGLSLLCSALGFLSSSRPVFISFSFSCY